jgi:ADP-ribose pyrophosphatase YjhB (NUDIX family)|tara:strand:+ start:4773 stop:5219 length:447 start_codon:yes stop_codon:yes gene_type:complete
MENIICSGALFYSLKTQRFLFLHRTQSKQNNVWGLVGGTNEDQEIPYKALLREIEEELGNLPKIIKSIPLETFVSNDEKFSFHTYLCVVNDEFMPILNQEHDGYAWCSFNKWPKPLHQGLRNTLQNKMNLTKLQTVFQLVSLLQESDI